MRVRNRLRTILEMLVALTVILFASFLYCTPGCKSSYEQITFGPIGEMDPVVSPDGKWLAFRAFSLESPEASEAGGLRILSLDPGKRESELLLNPDQFYGGASWSPDSLWLSYSDYETIQPGSIFTLIERRIYKVNIVSKERVQLTPSSPTLRVGEFTSWSKHGEIAFVMDNSIYAIQPDGSNLRKLVDVESKEPNLRLVNIAWSPDGKLLAFSAKRKSESGNDDESTIWLADVQSGHLRRVTTDLYDDTPTWQDSETIVFSRGSDNPPGVSLYSVSIHTGAVKKISHKGMGYSPWVDQRNKVLYFSSAERFDPSGDDFNFFRGFHIWRLPIKCATKN